MRKLLLAMFAVMFLTAFILSAHSITNRLDIYEAARIEYVEVREELGITALIEAIDFEVLNDISTSSIAWIEVPGTRISYPIAQGTDNERYLYHTLQGNPNPSGAIFMDYRNCPNFTDSHTLIYGHNMRDGTMFAALHTWQGDVFFIHSPAGRMDFKVFNREVVSQYHELYQLPNSISGADSPIITLSTCVSEDNSMRFVVQGKYFQADDDIY